MTDFSEIFRHGDPIPVGYRHGNLLTGLRIDGRDPERGELGVGINRQLEFAYENLRRAVLAGGGGVENIGQVSFFLADFEERFAINDLWVAMFPEPTDRPTYKFMAAPLPDGELVQLEFLAVLGERRRDIEIDGVAHTNPIPLAVRMGEYLFTSRILPHDPVTEKAPVDAPSQARFVLENSQAVLDAAGMSWSDVTQGRGFFRDLRDAPLLVDPWALRFPEERSRPPLHQVSYDGGLAVMLELIARERRD